MTDSAARTIEQSRLMDPTWRRWGTYLSERAWGSVREDYSASGDAWSYFPFEHARSRAYRWNEDGLAGFCDDSQILCFGLALWNGQDSILKERPFGLSNAQGNHGEDVKDYWFYTDNVPSHAYASMIYKYPQAAFPYQDLVDTNARTGLNEPEYELLDALHDDWIANRYFDVLVEYGKAGPEDIVCRVSVTNRGTEAATVHLLPQAWFRNTWTWTQDANHPTMTLTKPGTVEIAHAELGTRWWHVSDEVIFCENETNNELLFGSPNASPTCKDGINDAVVGGDHNAVSTGQGTKAAVHATVTIAPGQTHSLRWRFSPIELSDPLAGVDDILSLRKAEADDFYASVQNERLSDDETSVQRQALAGLLWCKQFYHYEVDRWLVGDPNQPTPPEQRWGGRNTKWRHLVNADVILMPDAWEYPWYATWDLAFHCATMALIDPEFAKRQLLMIMSTRYQHPHGMLPAYEWNFSDANPPVIAWAAWRVYQLDAYQTGKPDRDFLVEILQGSTIHLASWVNRFDPAGDGLFGGGFLGLDNIGVFNRDDAMPTGGQLLQVDGTAWVAELALQLLEICAELAMTDAAFKPFLDRLMFTFAQVAHRFEVGTRGVCLWSKDLEFYRDVIAFPDHDQIPLDVVSLEGLVPLIASVAIPLGLSNVTSILAEAGRDLSNAHPVLGAFAQPRTGNGSHDLYSVIPPDRLTAILARMLDPDQLLSAHGIRSLSREYLDHPYTYNMGDRSTTVAYMPAESRNRMFGGNSNWRGPVWFPINLMLIESLMTLHSALGASFTVEYPTGSGVQRNLAQIAADLSSRLTSIFTKDANGRRPVHGERDYVQTDPHWSDLIPFHEYFDGDDGHGCGASHQTGWTASVALLMQFGGQFRAGVGHLQQLREQTGE
ncbi:MAG: glucosidase [Actinomycetes bacterium]